jgi:predicted dehydrogenase
MKIGVIGVGHLGSIHAKLWSENEDVELVGIYDTENEKAQNYAEALGIRNFADLEEVADACDAVTIATSTVHHHKVAKAMLEKGVHCLIEKPITATYEEAQDLIQTAEQNGAAIRVGHVERFNPALAALSDYKINPMFIEAHRLSQFRTRATDVSVIHDLMIHDIDIVLWLAQSKVKTIDANGVAVVTDTPDICNARITFENGMVANLTASRISANPMRKMRVFQKDAYFSIDFGKPDVEVYKIGDSEAESEGAVPAMNLGSIDSGSVKRSIFYSKPNVEQTNAIAEEQKEFVKAAEGGNSLGADARSATEALRVAEEINSMVLASLEKMQ